MILYCYVNEQMEVRKSVSDMRSRIQNKKKSARTLWRFFRIDGFSLNNNVTPFRKIA